MRELQASSDSTGRTAQQAVRTDQLLGMDQILIATPPRGTTSSRQSERIESGGIRSEPGMAVDPTTQSHPIPTIELLSEATAEQQLEHLKLIHQRDCPHCTRSTTHQHIVFGEGDPNAELMFIGEAPGEEEDRTGRPFVGRAGSKLDEMITAMGFRREGVYIANVLKTRPPENRTPVQHEVEACAPYLAAQVQAIKPRALVALGGPAAKLLLQTDTGITQLRGTWGHYGPEGGSVPVMPTFHPAYLLRNPTREVRGQVWDDLKKVLARLGREVPT